MSANDILTVAETAAADQAAIAAGTPGFTLMLRAGAAVAEVIAARWTPRRCVVLCGPGNNGGDGFVIAARLAEAGWPVTLALEGDRAALKGDAAEAAALWTGPIARVGPAAVREAELVVDALFGAGLSKPLGAIPAETLRYAELGAAPLVAVDLPSGLSGDTGAPLGYAPRADLTVIFHRKKPAHVIEPGRGLCGEVVVADIGLSTAPSTLTENGPALWAHAFPWPAGATHKHSRGRLIVVSGEMWSTGAAIVIDADALTAFRDDPAELFSVLDRDDVLTPHQGEFERVFPGLLRASPERITAARQAAARAHAVVLLKGPDTVIAAPDGRCAVNVNGTPWLATAGSGDVLAGFIGGLIAQGMDSFEAACAGVWIHAEAARLHGPGLISEDLPGLAPQVLRALLAARG